ncbi:hypothetical protein N7468_009156 [Penicillium chermesinum]|uniref:NACHT domain-containing protein n=1 Tax=Penicillium chermesinum TaxID=63820 RepID=A0A9W9NHG6_9EURO|nr:uncharacterized protein N7468_009156 [Penicillium chermesinum]KAJ5219952.1 hypothetical protein N7468_009156 [Penicillium chermesinum]
MPLQSRSYVRPSYRRDFHIAIICALAVEYDAVSLLVDEFWDRNGHQYGRTSGDPNTYRNGRIGEHNVVLLLLPGIGSASAASAAASLRKSYPMINLVFLVGVCGGVPSVGGLPSKFVPKDATEISRHAPSKDIRGLIAYLKTGSGRMELEEVTDENLRAIRHAAASKSFEHSYEYPGPSEDELFAATYNHKHRNLACDVCDEDIFCEEASKASCDELGCDKTQLVPRKRLRTPQAGRPGIFIGRVASADTVMKSGQHRDCIAEWCNAIAFEMEGAGLWDEVPSIVVKGVCDYADSHKHKAWQPFAAATAAAVTKSILNRYGITNDADSFGAESAVDKDVARYGQDIEHHVSYPGATARYQGRDMWIHDQKRPFGLLASLSVLDHLTPLKQARRKRQSGTAEWLFETKTFDRWVSDDGFSALWCSGKIGSGKTILAASVVDWILTEIHDSKALVSFLFVRFDDYMSLETESILKSILFQVLDKAGFPDEVAVLLADAQHKLSSTPKDLINMLGLAYTTLELKRIYIVIDGIDECPKQERDSLLSALASLRLFELNIRVFISGRESVSSEVNMEFRHLSHLSMRSQLAQSDIATYINKTVDQKLRNEELIVGDNDLIEEIKDALRQGADGMMLWVAFQIDALCSQRCDEDIRRSINDLPKDLTEVFNRALWRIVAQNNTEIASRCFLWVAAAKRPLSINELKETILIEIGQEHSKPERWPNGIHKICSWCENLVQVDEETRIVQFPHRAVRQFLIEKCTDSQLENFHVDLKQADHHVGEICVTYLNFTDFKLALAERTPPRSLPKFRFSAVEQIVLASEQRYSAIPSFVAKLRSMIGKMPEASNGVGALPSFMSDHSASRVDSNKPNHSFLRYASENMLLHTKSFQQQSSIMWEHWEKMILHENHLIQYPWGIRPFKEDDPIIIAWCCKVSHVALLRLIYRRIELLGMQVPERLSVWKAVECYDLDFLSLLIDAGADVNLRTSQGYTALHYATSKGSMCLVSRLIAAGADVNLRTQPPMDFTALYPAVTHVFHTDGRYLETFDGYSTLPYATSEGIVRNFDGLLAAGADVNLQMFKDSTTLYSSIPFRDSGATGRTGAFGEDVDLQTSGGSTALHIAIKRGCVDVVDELLAAGADVNLRTSEGSNALYVAVEYSRVENVHSLLAAGAEVDLRTSDGSTALHKAAFQGNIDIFDWLLAAGADVNLQTSEGSTALYVAVDYRRENIVDRLLAAGANVNLGTFKGFGALQRAAKQGSVHVVDRLLAAGAGVNLQTSEGSTALHEVASKGNIDVVDRLLAANADINLQASNGYSALLYATSKGNVGVVDRLLAAGADVNLQTSRGSTALHIAVQRGHMEIIDKLLIVCAGAGVNIRDLSGNTALHYATAKGKVDIVNSLLAAGADTIK